MMTKLCPNCLNYGGNKGDAMICIAFPTGIPQIILDGHFDHRLEYPGDYGVRYEPMYPLGLDPPEPYEPPPPGIPEMP